MTTQKKNRVISVENILVFIIIGMFAVLLIVHGLSKIDKDIYSYQGMKEAPKVETPIKTVSDNDLQLPLVNPEDEEQYLTERQQLLKKAGLNTDLKPNWTLIEGIGALVEHEVGWNAYYYEGYDFDEIQQVMATSIINRLCSTDFPNNFYYLVNQDGQYPDTWEYICTHHHRVKEQTLINVVRVFYNKGDYNIPQNVFFEYSFPYNEELEEPTDVGEVTPAVGDIYQASEWLSDQNISSGLYAYSSYIYDEGNGVKRLLIFAGSSTDSY